MTRLASILGMDDPMANDVEIDVAAGKLTVFKGLCPKDAQASWEKAAVELPLNPERSGQAPAQFTVRVQGRALKAIFDTGAVRSLLHARPAAELGLKQDAGAQVAHAVGVGRDA